MSWQEGHLNLRGRGFDCRTLWGSGCASDAVGLSEAIPRRSGRALRIARAARALVRCRVLMAPSVMRWQTRASESATPGFRSSLQQLVE